MKTRTILFRGQKINSKEWVEGSLYIYNLLEKSNYFILNSAFMSRNELHINSQHEVKPESVGQFTNLTDNSTPKKQIFENDLFEVIFKDCPDGFEYWGKKTTVIKITGRVCFKFGCYMVEMTHPESKELVYLRLVDFLKNPEKVVIGNTTDNPELLT